GGGPPRPTTLPSSMDANRAATAAPATTQRRQPDGNRMQSFSPSSSTTATREARGWSSATAMPAARPATTAPTTRPAARPSVSQRPASDQNFNRPSPIASQSGPARTQPATRPVQSGFNNSAFAGAGTGAATRNSSTRGASSRGGFSGGGGGFQG